MTGQKILKTVKIFEVRKLLKALAECKQNTVLIDGYKVRNHPKYLFFLKQGLKCRCCKEKVAYVIVTKESNCKSGFYHLSFYLQDDTLLTIDHIVPKSIGGEDDKSNLQALCKRCNHAKGERIIKYD